MCIGPIKIHWIAPVTSPIGQRLDDNLVVLLGSDFSEMNPTKPHRADENQFDFFFLVRRDLPAALAHIAFWFPYPAEQTSYGANDMARTQQHFPYLMSFLRRSLVDPNPSLPESFGWSESELARLLPTPPSPGLGVAPALSEQLGRIGQIANFACSSTITLRPLTFPGDGTPTNQHYLATLVGDLKAGDLLHIYFRLHGANAVPLDEASAQAVFYYYDDTFHPVVTGHPMSDSPLVPCAMMHVAHRSTTPFERFWTDTGATPSFAKLRHLAGDAISPTGYRYREMYWFTLFNAHLGHQGGEFTVRWRYAKPAATADPLVAYLKDRPAAYRDLVLATAGELGKAHLTPSQRDVLMGISGGQSLKELATARGLSVKTLRNYYDAALSLLGLKRSGLDPASRREIITLAVQVQSYVQKSGRGLDAVRRLLDGD